MISVASGLYFSMSSSSLIRRTVGYWERERGSRGESEWGSGGEREWERGGERERHTNTLTS